MFFIGFYNTTATLLAILDVIVGFKALKRHKEGGRFLGLLCFMAATVSFNYIFSVSIANYRVSSVFSSLYFMGMDAIAVLLLSFVIEMTDFKKDKGFFIFQMIIRAYAIFEVVIFIINAAGNEIAISYIPQNNIYARYAYDMKPLYWCHLFFNYSCILVTVIILCIKATRVPREYRTQYTFIVYMIIGIVIINAIFLFIPKDPTRIPTLVDYGVFTYSLAAMYCYWAKFQYANHGMLNHLKSYVFENVDQGIILFDYENDLVLANEKSKVFLNSDFIRKCKTLDKFLVDYSIPLNTKDDAHTFQIYVKNKQTPLRCDYRNLKNDRNQNVGKLFVFSDAALETDLTTGFHNWESFVKFAKETTDGFPYPTSVGVCDINRMGIYNSIHGRNAGDQLIKHLSEKMRQVFPSDSYFVRGEEALLIVICHQVDEDKMKALFQQIANEFEEKLQYSISSIDKEEPNILNTIQNAITGLNARKLLDNESTHSAMLTSLVRALQESDSDTEAHVERTQKMGASLGKRIGLSDVEQSKLSLLCLLHDIGKIGVPLEVLNKPGKLTDEEWEIIKSHVEKGYSIAMSSPELSGIAEMIRYHHERWDGKGYPDGLSRESIPLLSRIICVVDAFDAMVNNRSYRKALPLEDAKNEIKRCAGSQFDPYIANEFLQMIEEEFFIPSKKQTEVIPTINSTQPKHVVESDAIHTVVYSKYILDSQMAIISIDQAFTDLTGYTQDDIDTTTITQIDLLPKEDRTDYLCMVNAQLAKNPIAYFEHRLLCKNGTIKYVICMGRKFFDSVAREERSEVIVVNSSTTYSAKAMANALEDKAQARLKQWEETYRRDSLTGLLNHISFMNDIEERLITDSNIRMMLIMMDIDKFKDYNDTFGHHAGDEFLIIVSQSIRNSIKPTDLSCRMGGDEFAVAIFYDEADEPKKIANDVFHKVNMQIQSAKDIVSLSMGVAIYNKEIMKGFDDLYEAADKALYQSKDNGRNKITF